VDWINPDGKNRRARSIEPRITAFLRTENGNLMTGLLIMKSKAFRKTSDPDC
jgi:hypothetical protein